MSKKIANQNAFVISQKTIANLKTEWQNLLAKYCSDEAEIDEIFQILVEKYSEKHRAYHNLSHINYLLKEAKKIEFEDFEAVFLATWFHDAIYEPKRSDNEIESAKMAVKILSKLSLPDNKIIKIEQIILATQTHSAENLDDDGKIFLDLDLSILGANEEIYQNYSRAIRREYAHVPNFLFRRGRKQILENFLKRETIYFTENLRERFEKPARLNLSNEIKELS
jgi:predicted metal-dependent HD superfamily phosphohydrolase